MKICSTSKILRLAGKMKSLPTFTVPALATKQRKLKLTFGLLCLILVAAAFYTASSASSVARLSDGSSRGSQIKEKRRLSTLREPARFPGAKGLFSLPLPALPQAPADESIETFASDCVTPQNVFNLGDTVCARISNAPLRDPALRQFSWSGTKGFVRQTQDVTLDPDTNLFTLPGSNTSTIDDEIVDNRGTWNVSSNSSGDNTTRAVAYFNVSDPANAAADLVVYDSSPEEAPITPGVNTAFFLWISNTGPDVAQNVHVTQASPPGLTFVSATQDTGPTFNCTNNMGMGITDCSIASLASGATATITLNYAVSGSASNGVVSSVADISSDTNDPRPDNNSSSARVEIRAAGGSPATCALGCPADIIATANTTQGTQSGAFVNFTGSVEVSGDCGAVTFNPASGSFFPVGTNSVGVTSGTGGGSCSFTVTVLSSAAPTIDCPLADVTAQASAGELELSVSLTPPSATGTGVTVSGIRSDNRDVTDPYPVGTTTVTWRATDSDSRLASCPQRVIVTNTDAPTISCPTNRTFTAAPGTCEKTVLIEDLGTPSTTPFGLPLTAERSDSLSLGAPYPVGQTVITWTATDSFGRSVSCDQTITVTGTGDTSPPVLSVPPDVLAFTSSCSALLDDELGVATATDDCSSSVNITRTGVPAGFVFPTGTTNVTYKATDGSGNMTTGIQHVTVKESPAIPPTVTAPANVLADTGPGATICGTVVSDATLGVATANDNCPGVTIARTGVPAGNVFPVGTTTVIYTATDASGNTASANQTVTVTDTTPPVVTAPAAVTLFTGPGATLCGVTVSNLDATLGTGSATDNCAGVGAVTRSGLPAGNVFPEGTTTVTYSATDAHGNTSSANQVVTVVDNTAPLITCPANITLEPTCPSGAVGTYTAPVGTDNCPGATTSRTAGLASGSVFPIGTNSVTYTVNDAHGNSTSCSFTVTVLTPAAVIQNMINEVNALPGLSGTQRQGLLSKLQAALDAVNQGKTNVACNKLNDFTSQVQSFINNGTLTPAQGQPLINSAAHVRNTLGCTALGCS